ncbi:MAG: GTP-binding protein [Verrucomicrobiae bacterium]
MGAGLQPVEKPVFAEQPGPADEQVAYADLLVINKVDLVSEVELREEIVPGLESCRV